MDNQKGSGSQLSGMSSFFKDGETASAVIREGYIQQAAVGSNDQQAVRNGDWDGRIPGFDLTKHILQNADQLSTKVPNLQT